MQRGVRIDRYQDGVVLGNPGEAWAKVQAKPMHAAASAAPISGVRMCMKV